MHSPAHTPFRFRTFKATLALWAGACFALALFLVLLPACSSAPTLKPESDASFGDQGPGVGIEVVWWVVDDSPFDDRLEEGQLPLDVAGRATRQVLAQFSGRPLPVSAEAAQRWRDNGLRLVSVPRRDVEAIRRNLRVVGPVQQQFMGEVTAWTEAARGPSWTNIQRILLDSGPLELRAGSLRLLARAWAAPGDAVLPDETARNARAAPLSTGVVQLQLVPQHLPRAAAPVDALRASLEPKKAKRPADDGLAFARLKLDMALSGREALLIVPESPDVEWNLTSSGDPSPAGGTIGPTPPSEPTLGELMLTDLASGAKRGTRIIVVLIPHAPRGYQLMP